MIKIAPSILSADFANLGRDTKLLSEAGADLIHIDVMDGNFVPNLTIGSSVVKAIRPYSDKKFDVHLMINNPEEYIEEFALAGSDYITFHIEAASNIAEIVSKIKSFGIKAGISFRPSTNLDKIIPYLDILDLVLVMTVEPGFGGQKFMPSQVEKVIALNKLKIEKKLEFEISVDGGINDQNAEILRQAGANILVSGSYIFSKGDIKKAILDLRI